MVLRSLRAMERADVVILVLDSGGVAEQDTKIAGYAHEAGKAVLVVVNKWDLIEEKAQETPRSSTRSEEAPVVEAVEEPQEEDKTRGKGKDKDKPKEPRRSLAQKDYAGMIERYLPFISYAPIHFTSAETSWGVEPMFDDALEISKNLHLRVSTGVLNDTIRRAMSEHSLPSVKGKQIKIRYATQAEVSPPCIIIFCSAPDLLHFSYVRFLENSIRRKFPFRGVPLKIELRRGSGEMSKEERLKAKREATLQATLTTESEARQAKAKRLEEFGVDAEDIEDDDATVVEYMNEDLEDDEE
jgi:GTP-binding protein